MSEPLLHLSHISKQFPGVLALDDVHLSVRAGEVHVLLGENGAGKSTLVKIVTGAYQRTGGDISFDGRPLQVADPRHAIDAGISMVYQEINLAPHLTVAENVYLGHEPLRSKLFRIIDQERMNRLAGQALSRFHLQIDPATPVQQLSVAQQQMVEIVKAFSTNARLIILDEPTATLTSREIDELFTLIRKMKAEGVAFIYISHRLEELPLIGDQVTVLRDGRFVATVPADTAMDELIRLMIGRTVDHLFPKRHVQAGERLLDVENLTRDGVFHDVGFSLRQGEILGVAGLVGAGRTEMARAIFGADKADSGRISLEGRPLDIQSPCHALKQGIAYVSEDRKGQSMALGMSVQDNITLAELPGLSGPVLLNAGAERECAEKYRKELDIRMTGPEQPAGLLSGGNQQKVVIARLLATNPKVLIFDEPTRGVDVGAKVEIYQLINQLVERGTGVILISSYLPELLALSDRVLVMREGRVSALLNRDEATQENILAAATTGTEQAA
jgi:ribose transport system ATP-binding protein